MIKNKTEADERLRATVISYLRSSGSTMGLADPMPPHDPPVCTITRLNQHGNPALENEEATHASVYITWTDHLGVGHLIDQKIDLNTLRDYWKDNLSRTAAKAGPTPVPPELKSEPTVQRSWMNDRARILALTKPKVRAGTTGTVWDVRGALRDQQGRMICACLEQVRDKSKPCDHLMYAYLTGMDNQVLNLPGTNSVRPREFKVLIGLGTYVMPIRLLRAKDETDPDKIVKFLVVTSEVEVRLRSTLNLGSDSFIMSDDEGLFGYIQYVEDMIRETETFKKLNLATLTNNATFLASAGGCNRHHAPAVKARVMGALAPSNPMRDAWMLGNIASLHDQGSQCLGCRQLAVGEHDVPNF